MFNKKYSKKYRNVYILGAYSGDCILPNRVNKEKGEYINYLRVI